MREKREKACRDFRNHVGGRKASVVVRRDVASEWSGEVFWPANRCVSIGSSNRFRGRNFSTVGLTRGTCGILRQVFFFTSNWFV